MTLVRMIAPQWLLKEHPSLPSVVEGQFTNEQIKDHNEAGYNIYYRPNYPKVYNGGSVTGQDIDTFEYVFVDCDLKDGVYKSKEEFLEYILDIPTPNRIVDSGNGIHAYWRVTDLDCKSYLRFQRRLMRLCKTDPAVGTIAQLMRLENTVNTKNKDNFKLCHLLSENSVSYTSEELDKLLPAIALEDEQYCIDHYNSVFNLNQLTPRAMLKEMPLKWGEFLRKNSEAKSLFSHTSGDRSDDDFRLALLMQANKFNEEEAFTVLMNSGKAIQRAPHHRESYATNIINKIWVKKESEQKGLAVSVEDLLATPEVEKGKRFRCFKYVDDTIKGFRLGHVLGLVGGSGVGKTTMALNLFLGFAASNPDYHHFFCSLEMPSREIAERWKNMCGENTSLHSKVHIISNYDESGKFRDLSLDDIKNDIMDFQTKNNRKVGCVVIDHIGILCNNNRLGQDEGTKQICKSMKSFAIETNTFLIMQSQTARSKAGEGDLELNKDAAFGTSSFENFVDYLVTIWQPLKRVYYQGAPTIMTFKFCKIRHKKQGRDKIEESVKYNMFFDPNTELIRELTQEESIHIPFYLKAASAIRKNDKDSDVDSYVSRKVDQDDPARTDSSSDPSKH